MCQSPARSVSWWRKIWQMGFDSLLGGASPGRLRGSAARERGKINNKITRGERKKKGWEAGGPATGVGGKRGETRGHLRSKRIYRDFLNSMTIPGKWMRGGGFSTEEGRKEGRETKGKSSYISVTHIFPPRPTQV